MIEFVIEIRMYIILREHLVIIFYKFSAISLDMFICVLIVKRESKQQREREHKHPLTERVEKALLHRMKHPSSLFMRG